LTDLVNLLLACATCDPPSGSRVASRDDAFYFSTLALDAHRWDSVTVPTAVVPGDASDVPAPTEKPASRRGRPLIATPEKFAGVWIRTFFVLFVLCAAWSLATPLGGAPDEPAQIVKAAATVRGELIGQASGHELAATRAFQVPAVFKPIYSLPTCYQFHPTIPAGCAPHLSSSGRLVTVLTYVARYPPLYYSMVGLPTLVSHSSSVIYFMRLVSALIDALLLSLAMTVAAVWCRSTMMFEAIALTVTPLVIFFASVVNPSGFEIAAAICAWTSGLALVRNGTLHPARPVVVTFVVSGCLLELTRGLSVLWMALIVVTLVCLEPASCVRLLRQLRGCVAAGVLGVVGVIALAYVIKEKTLKVLPSTKLPPSHASFVVLTEHVFGQVGGYLNQLIGVFGWLDTPSPLLTTILWAALIGFLLVLGLTVSNTREGIVLIGLIVGAFVLTTALIEWNAGTSGITWQARDGFPLYAGIPLVAGIVVPRSSIFGFGNFTRWRLAVVVALAVGLSQLGDFLWTLRRYTVGLGRTVNLFRSVPHGWSPPGGTPLVAALGVVTATLYAGWLFHQMNSREWSDSTPQSARIGRHASE
jgi:hypothetical protein